MSAMLAFAELLGSVRDLHSAPPLEAPKSSSHHASRTQLAGRSSGSTSSTSRPQTAISKVSEVVTGTISYDPRELVPYLGPGILALANRVAPPILHRNNLFHTVELTADAAESLVAPRPHVIDLTSPAAAPVAPSQTATVIRRPLPAASTTSLQHRSTPGHAEAASKPAVTRTGIPIRTAATTTINRAAIASNVESVTATVLRMNEDTFTTALLQLPVLRLVTDEGLDTILALSEGERAPLSRSTKDMSPPDTPKKLLPSVPRPTFEHFFGWSDKGRGSAATSSSKPWPADWMDYHSTMAALLLEEARCMVATNIVSAARAMSKPRGSAHQAASTMNNASDDSVIVATGAIHRTEKYYNTEEKMEAGCLLVFNASQSKSFSGGNIYKSQGSRLELPRSKDLVLVRSNEVHGPKKVVVGVVVPSRGDRTAARTAKSASELWIRVTEADVSEWTSRACTVISVANTSLLLHVYQSILSVAYTTFAGLVFRPQWCAKQTEVTNFLLSPIPPKLLRALTERFDGTQLMAIAQCASGGAYHVPVLDVSTTDGSFRSVLREVAAGTQNRSYCEVTSIIGPPGTGKTRTMLGIISAIRACCAGTPATSTSEKTSTVAKRPKTDGVSDRAARPRARILVCAASNAAVDEIVTRLLGLSAHVHADNLSSTADTGGGLLDENGEPFIPNVVRVGAGAAVSSRTGIVDRSLDVLCHKRLRERINVMAKDKRRRKTSISLSSDAARKVARLEERATQLRKSLDALQVAATAAAAASEETEDDEIVFLGSSPTRIRSNTDTVATRIKRSQLLAELDDVNEELRYLDQVDLLELDASQLHLLRQQSLSDVLLQADVIASTLSGTVNLLTIRSGGRVAEGKQAEGGVWRGITFEAIIIDEAGQATEAETLIPLRSCYTGHVHTLNSGTTVIPSSKLNALPACRRLVLIGDPLQLPATVLSRSAALNGLDISLFERTAAAGITPILLKTQYRMHSSISGFSSSFFYKGLVKDAAPSEFGVAKKSDALFNTASEHTDVSVSNTNAATHICNSTLLLADVPFGVESTRSDKGDGLVADPSYGNDAEVRVVVAFLRHLLRCNSDISIGVITPYREQVRRIHAAMKDVATVDAVDWKQVTVSTVDSFQGQECDVIIISCVRSKTADAVSRGIGFLADPRRLNVAVTRARSALILVGNREWLSSNDGTWRALLAYAAVKGRVVRVRSSLPCYIAEDSDAVACDEMEALLRGP